MTYRNTSLIFGFSFKSPPEDSIELLLLDASMVRERGYFTSKRMSLFYLPLFEYTTQLFMCLFASDDLKNPFFHKIDHPYLSSNMSIKHYFT